MDSDGVTTTAAAAGDDFGTFDFGFELALLAILPRPLATPLAVPVEFIGPAEALSASSVPLLLLLLAGSGIYEASLEGTEVYVVVDTGTASNDPKEIAGPCTVRGT